MRWDSHPMLRAQAAEESKLPPGPYPPLLPFSPSHAHKLLPRLQQGPIPSPSTPQVTAEAAETNPLPQVSSWAAERANPLTVVT